MKTLPTDATMSSRPQTPLAIHQKVDIIDLTISPAPAKEFQLDNGVLSTSVDTDIVRIGEEVDSLLQVC